MFHNCKTVEENEGEGGNGGGGREKERREEEGQKEKIDCSVHIVKWVASKRNCSFPFFLKIR